jgi:quinol monooxygenase YgiN
VVERQPKEAERTMEFSGDELMAMERVSLVANPAKIEEICEAFRSLMGPTQAQRGCLRCELYTGWPGPSTVLLESLWRTREDLVRHLQSDRYKSLLQLVERSVEQPLIEFFFVSRKEGLEIVEDARKRLS